MGDPVGVETSSSCFCTYCCHFSVKEEEAETVVADPCLSALLPVREEAEVGAEGVNAGLTVPPPTPEFGDLLEGDDGEHLLYNLFVGKNRTDFSKPLKEVDKIWKSN